MENSTERKPAKNTQPKAEPYPSVTELANAAAHEINNPLHVITGNLELMARRLGPDDPNRDSIQRTLEACQRISEMVQHMGKITRSEEHTSELQSPCNLVCRLLLEKKKKNQ